MNKKFAIVGCIRSGTTLLGLVLRGSPDIKYFEEENAVNVFRENDCNDEKYTVGFKLTALTHEAKEFASFDPSMKFIFVTRHIPAVCASMIKLGAINSILAGDQIQKTIDSLTQSTYRDWIITQFISNNFRHNKHKMAALLAQIKYNHIMEFLKYGLDVIEVKYEHLIACPYGIIDSIAKFLDITKSNDMYNHTNKFQEFRLHGTSGKRQIDSTSLFKYRSQFSEKQLSEILVISSEAFALAAEYYSDLDLNITQTNVSDIENEIMETSQRTNSQFHFLRINGLLTEREKILAELVDSGANIDQATNALKTDNDGANEELINLQKKNAFWLYKLTGKVTKL